MIPLPYIFYRNIHSSFGGPIERLSSRRITMLNGLSRYDSLAYLSPRISNHNQKSVIFSTAEGNGTAESRSVSIFKAISEALERWAFLESYQNQEAFEEFGFHVNPHTTGFSAYPEIFPYHAKKFSFLEAAERWCILHWWFEALSHESLQENPSGIRHVRIVNPFPQCEIVVSWMPVQTDFFVYGFGSGFSLSHALQKAMTELSRNKNVFEKTDIQRHISSPPSLLWERRFLYFGMEKGREDFLQRLSRKPSVVFQSSPEFVVNREIRGPWTKYAKVWRCLFKSLFAEDNEQNVFVF